MQHANRLALRLAILGIAAAAAVFPSAVPVSGQTPGKAPGGSPGRAAEAQPSKVGVVNLQEAMANTQEGKKELDALKAKFAPQQASLKTLNDEVEKMKADLNATQNTLSPQERAQREKAVQAKQADLQKKFEAAQAQFQAAEQGVVNRLGGKLLKVLQQVADGKGYDLVLDVSNPQTPVMWARPNMNLTSDLVAAYDATYPVK